MLSYNIDHRMNLDAATKCCAKASRGSTHGDNSEENTPASRQAVEMHIPTPCLPAVLQRTKDESSQGAIYRTFPENKEGGIQGPAGTSLLEEKAENNVSGESGSSTDTLAEYGKTSHGSSRLEETTDDDVATPLSISSQDTPAIGHAIKLNHTPSSAANAEAPNESSINSEAGSTVTPAGADNSECAAVSASKLWIEFLNASIPANVRAYEELFRRCITPAASASPTTARKTGNTIDPPRKDSTITDDGNSSLSRYETLSTQPSHPRMYADDVADDSLPRVLAAPLTSAQEHGEEVAQRPACATAGDGDTGNAEAATVKPDTKSVAFSDNQRHTENLVAGRDTEMQGVPDSNRQRSGSSGSSCNDDIERSEKDALWQSAEEHTGLLSQRFGDTRLQGSRAPAEGCALSALLLPSNAAVVPAAHESGKASHRTLVSLVASLKPGKSEAQKSWESITPLRADGGRKESMVAEASSIREGRTSPCPQTPGLQSPKRRENTHTPQPDGLKERKDATTCSNASSVAPAATNGTGGEPHAAEEEKHGAYGCADSSSPHGSTGEHAALTGESGVRATSVSDARRENNASPAAEAAPARAVLTGISTSGESKTSRVGMLGGEASAHVGSRGRPSLGAAGRQLLLDRIRAQYHTNVGLYSGVLRKNYNSTISKLPFFTVSLLHRLAADFGIDTNAVLEQQHYDSTRGSGARHNAESVYSAGGRGARQGGGSGHAKGPAGSTGEFCHRKSSTADNRTLVDTPQDANASPEKRRSRQYVDSWSRRRGASRATKKSESICDGAVDASPVTRGADVCEVLSVRGRAVALRSIRTHWGCEASENSAERSQDQQQETPLRGENAQLQGGLVSFDYDGERLPQKFHIGRSTNTASGSRVTEETPGKPEAWLKERELGAEISCISPVSGAMAHAAALVATERQREELGERFSAERDGSHANSRSSCPGAELLGSSNVARVPENNTNGERWRTVAGVPLLLPEQKRDQHRFQTASGSVVKDKENEGHRSAGDLNGLQSCSGKEAPPAAQTDHVDRWLSGLAAPTRTAGTGNLKENQHHPALEAYASALSYLRRPTASENATYAPGAHDTSTTEKDAVAVTEEKGRPTPPVNASPAQGSSGGIVSGLFAGDESSTRAQNNFKNGVPLCGMPDARYLWSVLFGHLPNESGHSHVSMAVGQETCRNTAAGGAKGEEAGTERRIGSERLLPHLAAGVSQQLDIRSEDKWGLHEATSLDVGAHSPKEMLAHASLTPASAGVRTAEEDWRICRSRERLLEPEAGINKKPYGDNLAESVANAFAASAGGERAVVAAAHVTDVKRDHARAVEAEHLRKRMKTEARWPQHEEEVHRPRLAQPPQPLLNNDNPAHCRSYAGLRDPSLSWGGDPRAIVDEERILELLTPQGQALVTRVAEEEANRVGPQETAATCFFQKAPSCTVQRGAGHGVTLGDAVEFRPPKTADGGGSEDLFAARRVHDGDARPASAEEREVGWKESLHLQSKLELVVRAGGEGSSGREPTTQIDGRLASTGYFRAPVPAPPGDVDSSHGYENNMQWSVVRQHGDRCRRQLVAAACKRQSTGGSGEPHGIAEGTLESPKFSQVSSTAEPWWSGALNAKTTAINAPRHPGASVAAHVTEHLTASRTPALPTPCKTPSAFMDGSHCTYVLAANELNRQQQPTHQHQRHQAVLCERDRIATLGAIKGGIHADEDTKEVGAAPHVRLSRVAAKNDTLQNACLSNTNCANQNGGKPPAEDTRAGKDAWPSGPELSAQKTGSLDLIPLVSLLLCFLLSEEPTRAPETNASAGSRYASRVVALLQTLSKLQRRLTTMQLPIPLPQTGSVDGDLTVETQHTFPSSSSLGIAPQARENTPLVENASDLDISGCLSLLLPALLQKVGDKHTDTPTTIMRPPVDVPVQQPGLHANQRRHGKQHVGAASGHTCCINEKNKNVWIAMTQEASGSCGNYYEVGESSTSGCLRPQEPTHTPLALELVESFLKAQGFTESASGCPDERGPSTAPPRQDRLCAHGNSNERYTSKTCAAASIHGLAEETPTQKAAGKKHSLGQAESISEREETPRLYQRG